MLILYIALSAFTKLKTEILNLSQSLKKHCNDVKLQTQLHYLFLERPADSSSFLKVSEVEKMYERESIFNNLCEKRETI